MSEAYRKVYFLRDKLHILDWKDAYRESSYRWAGRIGRMIGGRHLGSASAGTTVEGSGVA